MNLEKLRKEAANIKEDAVTKNTDKLQDYILKLYDEYYYSYVNNDMATFNAAADHLEDAITVAYGQYNNVNNYINSCKASILTKIMNVIFKRDVTLELPDANVPIDTAIEDMDERVLKVLSESIEKKYRTDEKDRIRRYEEYFREIEKECMATGYYVKHLIRPDADADFITDNMDILESILTDEGIAAVNYYISGGNPDGCDN